MGVAKNQAKAPATTVNQVAGVAGERYHFFVNLHEHVILGTGSDLHWGSCSKMCGEGVRSRQRECVSPPKNQTNCEGRNTQKETCFKGNCSGNKNKLKVINIINTLNLNICITKMLS